MDEIIKFVMDLYEWIFYLLIFTCGLNPPMIVARVALLKILENKMIIGEL